MPYEMEQIFIPNDLLFEWVSKEIKAKERSVMGRKLKAMKGKGDGWLPNLKMKDTGGNKYGRGWCWIPDGQPKTVNYDLASRYQRQNANLGSF